MTPSPPSPEVKERPIFFSAPMVQALLAGRKTQTRRPVKGDPTEMVRMIGAADQPTGEFGLRPHPRVITKYVRCPYGQPGDRLWVRETWSHTGEGVWSIADARKRLSGHPIYAATHDGPKPLGWWPSIHMPREFSRLTLEVTDVRVERLQDISEEDALAEGIKHWGDGFHWEANSGWPGEPKGMESARLIGKTARDAFLALWEEINGQESLDANPWVWAVNFKVLNGLRAGQGVG